MFGASEIRSDRATRAPIEPKTSGVGTEAGSDWRERERILLDEAAAVSADACRTLETTNLPAMIVDQIQMQIDALRAATLHLTDHAHDVVFVGPVGSGKSTLLSVLAGLTLAEDEISEAGGSRLERRSVLASSAGRTSVCPLRIERGESVAIFLEPMAPPEVEALAREYVHELWSASSAADGGEMGTLVPEETARALRNMAGVSNRKLSTLMRAASAEKEFADRFVAMMKLDGRTQLRFEIPADAPAGWLKRTLAEINSGRCAEATLPHLVRVEIPGFEMVPGLRIALVDSKGTEGTHVRRDVRRALADERTIVVACSSFSSCPDEAAQGLVEHAREVAGTLASGRLCILGLAKNGEAASVRDEFGDPVENAQEGHRVRREQTSRVLRSLSPNASMEVLSIDAGEDDPADAREGLARLVLALRAGRAADVADLTTGLRHLAGSVGTEFVAMVAPVLEAAREIVDGHPAFELNLPGSQDVKPISAAASRYASRVWAATRRAGDYEFLNVHDAVADAYAKAALAAADGLRIRLTEALRAYRSSNRPAVQAVVARLDAQASRMPRTVAAIVHREVAAVSLTTLGQDGALWSRCSGLWGHPERRDGPYVAYVGEAVGSRLSRDGKFDADVRGVIEAIWTNDAVAPLRKACALIETSSPPASLVGGGAMPTRTGNAQRPAAHLVASRSLPGREGTPILEDCATMSRFFDALLEKEDGAPARPGRTREATIGCHSSRHMNPSGFGLGLESGDFDLSEMFAAPAAESTADQSSFEDHDQARACFERVAAFLARPRLVVSDSDLDVVLSWLRSIDREPVSGEGDERIALSGESMKLHWNPDEPLKLWTAGPMTAGGLTLPVWMQWRIGFRGLEYDRTRFMNAGGENRGSEQHMFDLAKAARMIPRSFIECRILHVARRISAEGREEVPPFPRLQPDMVHPPLVEIPVLGGILRAAAAASDRVRIAPQTVKVVHAGQEIGLHMSGSWVSSDREQREPTVSLKRKHVTTAEREACSVVQAGIHAAIAAYMAGDASLRERASRHDAMTRAYKAVDSRRDVFQRIFAMGGRLVQIRAELERIDDSFGYPCPS